jgi:MFS family permease
MSYLAIWAGFINGIFSTFFGAYLTNENNVSFSTAGQLFLLVGVLSIFSGILWGRASDRLGRGWAFALSFAVQGLGYATFWLIPVMEAFILGSIFIGLTLRAGYTLCAAGSGDYVPVNLATTAFAMMSVGAGLGATFSPIMAWREEVMVIPALMGIVGAVVLASSRASVQAAAAGAGG